MGHRLRRLALLTALGVVALASPAAADSRIFTARSSVPGVTLEQAFRNGEELGIVGRGDGTILFRIDSPSTPVGCANRIEYVTSTGERVEQVTDMCAVNWDVTVQVAPPAAATPPPPPAAATDVPPPPPPAGDSTFTQTVTVSTDDPGATILTVSLDGAPVAITGREGTAVTFEVAGTDEGIVCERDVGVTLSNGRQLTRNVNICLNDWTVEIALGDDGGPAVVDVPAPPATTPPPSAELPAPPAQPAPLSPAPTAPNPAMAWMFSSAGDEAFLAHGIPETDATAFSATCIRRSGRMTVTLFDAVVPGLVPGSAVPITFSAGTFTRTYPGIGSQLDELAGASLPQVEISAGDPLWSAIIREKTLGVTAGPWRGILSLSGSAGPARQLLAACSEAPLSPPPPPAVAAPPVGPGVVATYYCQNGQPITVTFNGARQTATLTEPGAPPMTLRWEPGRNAARYSAGPARLVLRSDAEVRWSRFGGPALTCLAR